MALKLNDDTKIITLFAGGGKGALGYTETRHETKDVIFKNMVNPTIFEKPRNVMSLSQHEQDNFIEVELYDGDKCPLGIKLRMYLFNFVDRTPLSLRDDANNELIAKYHASLQRVKTLENERAQLLADLRCSSFEDFIHKRAINTMNNLKRLSGGHMNNPNMVNQQDAGGK